MPPYGVVPPVAVTVTVDVPPLHKIAVAVDAPPIFKVVAVAFSKLKVV